MLITTKVSQLTTAMYKDAGFGARGWVVSNARLFSRGTPDSWHFLDVHSQKLKLPHKTTILRDLLFFFLFEFYFHPGIIGFLAGLCYVSIISGLGAFRSIFTPDFTTTFHLVTLAYFTGGNTQPRPYCTRNNNGHT